MTPGPNLIACENALTVNAAHVELDAPEGHHVDARPLFNGSSLTCIVPAPPCTDHGNTCGNTCEIPAAATCDATAEMLLMAIARFHELNPGLDCARALPAGTSVCMGGTCGD